MDLIDKLIEAGFIFISWPGRYGGGVQAALAYSEEHAERIANDFTAGDSDYAAADKYFNIADYPFAHGDSFADVIDLIEDKLSKFTRESMDRGGDYNCWLGLYCCNYNSYPEVSLDTDPIDPDARVPAPMPILTSPEDLAFLSAVKERQSNIAVKALLGSVGDTRTAALPSIDMFSVAHAMNNLTRLCVGDDACEKLRIFVRDTIFSPMEVSILTKEQMNATPIDLTLAEVSNDGVPYGWLLTVQRTDRPNQKVDNQRILRYDNGWIAEIMPHIEPT